MSTSCDVNNTDDGFSNTYSYQLQQNAAIATHSTERPIGDSTRTVLNFSVESGNNTVFIYEHHNIAPKGLADAGYSETLVFQIPKNTGRFKLTDSTFSDATALYKRSCFCPFSGVAFNVTAGTISGEKLSTLHWIIDADVTAEILNSSYELSFKEPFYAK